MEAKDISVQVHRMMEQLSFPSDALSRLDKALCAVMNDSTACPLFMGLLEQYASTIQCDYSRMLSTMDRISLQAGIHKYTGAMLLLLGMSDTLHKRFRQTGYPDELFFHTMMDLKYKLIECQLIYGIDGTFVADWYVGFYRLERFAFGRLQFELIQLGCSGCCGPLTLTPQTKAINIHIPRTGTPLYHQEVVESYRQAQAFYRHAFTQSPTVFTCESWLLDPWNQHVLDDKSNLKAFISDFTIIKTGHYQNYEDIWRVFDCLYTGDITALPQKTSLQRAYVKRIQENQPAGWGLGVFTMDLSVSADRGPADSVTYTPVCG